VAAGRGGGGMTPFDALMVQRFDDLYQSTPSAILPLDAALDAITDGCYADAIREARAVWAREGEDAYRAKKNLLPQITFAGTFAPTRAKDHLVTHSEICHADIDHLPDLRATKQHLQADPHVLYCFTSPRGDGLKYGVRIAQVESDDHYKHAWATLAAAHLHAYGVTWDPSGKDICRLCFVSWDPACYVNPAAAVYAVPPPMVTPRPQRQPRPTARSEPIGDRRAYYAERGIAHAVRLIADSTAGGLHEARRRAAYLLGGYVGGGFLTHAEAYTALHAAVEGHTKHLAQALKTITSGLTKGAAKPITLAELEADRAQWKETHPLPTPPLPAAASLRTPLSSRLSTTLRRRL
jgi:hypothetical protein